MKKIYNDALCNLIIIIGVMGIITIENSYAAAENNKEKREVVKTGESESALVVVAQDQDLDSQLMQAVQEINEEKVALLLETKASVNTLHKIGINTTVDTTVLMAAAHQGNIVILNALLSARANVDGQNSMEQTALMQAVFSEHTKVVKILLAAGATVDKQDYLNKDSALTLIGRAIGERIKISQIIGEQSIDKDVFIEENLNRYELMRLLLLAGADRFLGNKDNYCLSNLMGFRGDYYGPMYKAIEEKKELEQALLDNRDGELKELLRTYVPVALVSAIVDYDGDYLFLRERAKNR